MASVVLVSAAFPSSSPDASLLEGWIETALERNQEVIAARRQWEAAREGIPQARSLDDPMIGVELMRMDGTRLDDFDTVEWMASQRLPWFGKLGARASAVAYMAEAAGFRYLKTTREVRAKVVAAYWNLWAAVAAVETYRENRGLMAEFEAVARQRYAEGKGLLADLLRAEVEAARLQNDLITRERELEVSITIVNRLLSEPGGTLRKTPLSPELPELRWTLDEAMRSARLYSCLLISFRKEIEAREAMVRESRLEWAPDFEFRLAARQDRDQGGIQEIDTGVALNFPWLWSGKYRSGVRQARAELSAAEARLQNEMDMLLLEVKELYTRADTSRRTVELFEEVLLPRARQLLQSTLAAYEFGQAGFLELIEAQKILLETELEQKRARARLAGEIARLEVDIAPWDESELRMGLVERQ